MEGAWRHRKNVAANRDAAGEAAAVAHPEINLTSQQQEAVPEHAAVDIPVKLSSPRS